MAQYKCISCGTVKESEMPCNCSVCGYKMFELPYEKNEILIREIRNFIAHLKLGEISKTDLLYFRKVQKKDPSDLEDYDIILKQTDDQRFPDYKKIQKYSSKASKTEQFCARLNESIEQVRKHINSPYSQSYEVSLEKISTRMTDLDTVLKEALVALGLKVDLPEIELPSITLKYRETPDSNLVPIAEGLLSQLQELVKKILVFIKQNNIYGTAYQYTPREMHDSSGEVDYAAKLRQKQELLKKTISKRFSVDIFSDGTEELHEMLKAFWNAFGSIMYAPVLSKEYEFSFSDGMITGEDNIGSALVGLIAKRYEQVDAAIYAYDFLSEKSENELFDLYDKMIDLDVFGFSGNDKSNLLKIGESEKKLNEMIGLSGIKESIKKIKAYALANKDSKDLNIHMCFLGNPGSGKTEVARYIAGILYENKILPTKKIIEVDRSGLVSQYFGATAEKTSGVIASAMGGVLFIDEAYALGNNSDHGVTDYGKEAIDTLVKAMEDFHGKFCVILAGYKSEMLQMLSTNPGFKSRIQFTLDFPNYSRDELNEIATQMLKKRQYSISDAAMSRILDITDIKRKEPNFANAREIRNVLDQVIMCQNVRCLGTDDKELGIVDVNKYIEDVAIHLPTGFNNTGKILSGEEELDQLVGLQSVKHMLKKIKAYAKRNKGTPDFNLHMCFYGNPGTGKTVVGRILSRILYDAGALKEAKMIETDAHGLIGQYVGETAPKTQKKIDEAMNGVLFIDEAYVLASNANAGGSLNNYGEEAIATLLKGMEDHRGQFCVILAGYKEEMKALFNVNPGFESRIQFVLEFPDYSREELEEIAISFLSKKKYIIKEDALKRVMDIVEYYRAKPNFANARTMRNVLDQVILNQNLRTEDIEANDEIILQDVEDYLTDEGIDLGKPVSTSKKIGFV